MPDEKPELNQQITARDGNQNYQAGRDVNIHNHPSASSSPTSPIVKATNAQIAEYDPKTSALLHKVRRHRVLHPTEALLPFPFITVAILIVFLLYMFRDWLIPLLPH
jgi:hypothetical protein